MMKIEKGYIMHMGENLMEVVYVTTLMGLEIVLLHPVDAPKGDFFVPMELKDGELKPVANEIIAESILNLYKQKIEKEN